MLCKNCNNELNPEDKECSVCGRLVEQDDVDLSLFDVPDFDADLSLQDLEVDNFNFEELNASDANLDLYSGDSDKNDDGIELSAKSFGESSSIFSDLEDNAEGSSSADLDIDLENLDLDDLDKELDMLSSNIEEEETLPKTMIIEPSAQETLNAMFKVDATGDKTDDNKEGDVVVAPKKKRRVLVKTEGPEREDRPIEEHKPSKEDIFDNLLNSSMEDLEKLLYSDLNTLDELAASDSEFEPYINTDSEERDIDSVFSDPDLGIDSVSSVSFDDLANSDTPKNGFDYDTDDDDDILDEIDNYDSQMLDLSGLSGIFSVSDTVTVNNEEPTEEKKEEPKEEPAFTYFEDEDDEESFDTTMTPKRNKLIDFDEVRDKKNNQDASNQDASSQDASSQDTASQDGSTPSELGSSNVTFDESSNDVMPETNDAPSESSTETSDDDDDDFGISLDELENLAMMDPSYVEQDEDYLENFEIRQKDPFSYIEEPSLNPEKTQAEIDELQRQLSDAKFNADDAFDNHSMAFTEDELQDTYYELKDTADKIERRKRYEESLEQQGKFKKSIRKLRQKIANLDGSVPKIIVAVCVLITFIVAVYAFYEPRKNIFYSDYSKEAINTYDTSLIQEIEIVVGSQVMTKSIIQSYLDGNISEDDALKEINNHLQTTKDATSLFDTYVYSEAESYTYLLSQYTVESAQLAELAKNAIESGDVPELKEVAASMEDIQTEIFNIYASRQHFLSTINTR